MLAPLLVLMAMGSDILIPNPPCFSHVESPMRRLHRNHSPLENLYGLLFYETKAADSGRANPTPTNDVKWKSTKRY